MNETEDRASKLEPQNLGLLMPASSMAGAEAKGNYVKDGACQREAFCILDALWCNLGPVRGTIVERNRTLIVLLDVSSNK